MARRPGWIVTDVLLMPTLELGNPVRLLVLVEPNDFPRLTLTWCFWLHDATANCIFIRNLLPGCVRQRGQDLQRLTLKVKSYTPFAQLPCTNIQLKIVETECARA